MARLYIANMTIDERLEIYSLDFDRMWSKVYLNSSRVTTYFNRKARFQNFWLRNDSGKLLQKLLMDAQGSSPLHWEFPRGRKNKGESDMECAIREFEEETSISRQYYQVLPQFRRCVIYTHLNVTYVHIYYAAVQTKDFPNPQKTISLRKKKQVTEVRDIGWMNLQQIQLAPGPVNRSLYAVATPTFKYGRKYFYGDHRIGLRKSADDAHGS